MSFDVLAPHYRWMESVLAGEKLQRCRTAFLDRVTAAKNVLIPGEGPGRFLVECRRRLPGAQITCVDASARMLAQARGRLPDANAVTFVHADALEWTPSGGEYDLIVTNFFLDCFRPDQLERMIARLARAAAADAHWLIADFKTPGAGLMRVRGRLILWGMYLFFRATTRLPARELTAPDSFLERAGFNLHQRIESEWGLLHSDWWRR